MKKLYLLWLVLGFGLASQAQNLSVTVPALSYCLDSTVTYSVTYSDPVTTYQANNVFMVQLSGPNGSFANPYTIGQLSSTSASGTIPVTFNLPGWFNAGTGHRIRVVSTNPVITGNNNGADIALHPMPQVYTSPGNAAICAGQSITLTAAGADTYTWQPGNLVGSTVTVSPSATTVYTVNGTNAAGCSSYAYQSVVVNNFQQLFFETIGPDPVIGPVAVVSHEAANNFDNDQLFFSSQAGSANIYSDPSHQSNGYAGASGGNYIFLNFNNIAVPVNWFQVGPINTTGFNNLMLSYGIKKSSPASNGSQLVLEYTVDGVTYTPLFQFPLPVGTGTQNPWYLVDSIAGMPASNNLYLRWRQTANNMAFYIDDIKLSNGGPQPVITASAPSANFCQGQTLNLTASSAASYQWSNGATSQIITVNQGGTFTVTETDGNGCTATSAPFVVTPSAGALSVTASSNSPVCSGQQLVLAATGPTGATYTWTTPTGTLTGQTITIANPTTADAGTYSVTANLQGCSSNIATTAVSVLPGAAPVMPVVGNSGPVCAGQAMVFNVFNPQAGVTYTWAGPNGTTNMYYGSTVTIPNLTPAHSGIYSVTAVGANGCINGPATTTVTVNPVPPTPMASNNGPICVGTSLWLSAVNTTPGAIYNWTGPNNFSSTQQNPIITDSSMAIAGTYTVTATVNGCTSAPAYTNVVVNPTPVALASNSGPVCSGDDLSFFSDFIPGATYTWSHAASSFLSFNSNPIRTFAQPSFTGNYSLTVTLNGCSSTDVTYAQVLNGPGQITVNSNQPVCPGQTLTLYAWGNAQTYSWSGPNGFIATGSGIDIPNLQPSDYGLYTATAGTGTCVSIGTITVGAPAAPGTYTQNAGGNVCPGATIYLGADSLPQNGTGYSWVGPNGFFSNQQMPAIPNASAVNSGTYSLYMLLNSCTSAPGLVQINVSPTLALSVANNGPVDQGGTLILTGTGSGGNYSWSGPNNYYAIGANPYIQDAQPSNSGPYTATLTSPGCSTITAITNVVVNPLNQLSGLVYNDLNNNGTQDAGELGLANQLVYAQPGNYTAITNSLGGYSMYVPAGAYTVSVINLQTGQTANPSSASVTFAGTGQSSASNDFGLYSSAIQNVMVTLTPEWNTAPGFITKIRINCKNLGSAAASGTIRFLPDPLLTLNSSTSGGYTMAGDTMVWTYSNLQPNMSTYRYVYMNVPVGTPLGTLVTTSVMATPTANDAAPANNYFTLYQTVVGSWDPNDKLVQPSADITPDMVLAGEELVYTVRFQNTGTAPAVNVMVLDTLSANLDLTSFHMLSSSHSYDLNLRNPGILEWKFNNVMLPDSNSNEPESHGFVQYSIKPKNTLQLGDQIKNTAHIYFDFNEAVVTNTTLNTVNVLYTPDAFRYTTLQLYPNPNTGQFTISLADCEVGAVQIKVLNMLGQEVYTEAANANNTAFTHQLHLPNLPEGMYLLQVRQGKKVVSRRMILQK